MLVHSSSRLFTQQLQPLVSSRGIRAPISCSAVSRRELLTASLASQPLLLSAVAAAAAAECSSSEQQQEPRRQVFMDISIDGEAAGRITVGIYSERAPAGAGRFMDLVSGKAGASYRRKDFFKVMPEYVQHSGVRSTSLGNEALKREWEALEAAGAQCPAEFRAGSVALVVRDPSRPPPKPKLVARGGRLQVDEEEVGLEPNGTQFLICTSDAPALHLSSLLIGSVLHGMDVVHAISRLPTVQDNTSSPYFRVAKLIGDKRAVVAERGFNRPYSKVLVTNCGFLH